MTTEPGAEPDHYRGVIIIEWPPPMTAGTPYSAVCGHLLNITDALTGKPIRTCTHVTVHADAGELVTADLTLFADDDGNPIYDGKPHVRDGDLVTGTFPFLVGAMKVRP